MPAAPLDRMDVMATQDCNGDRRPSRSMGRYALPLRHILHNQLAIVSLFQADLLIEAYVLHQPVEIMVVIADVAFVRGFISVLFQNPIGGLGIAGIAIDVYYGKAPRLLLGDTEDIAVKAGRLYPNHVGMALVRSSLT